MSRAAPLILTVILTVSSAWSEAGCGTWYEDPRQGLEGWYGYEAYEVPEEAEEEPRVADGSGNRTGVTDELAVTAQAWPTYEEALRMKPAELKEVLERAAEEAIGYPDEENVLRWASYMKATRVKSVRFASVLSWVTLNHPELSNETDSPIVAPARRALLMAQNEEVERRLREEAGGFAMILFVSNKAPLSVPASEICSAFARSAGWRLEVVDVDEKPQLAEATGVTSVPQAWVISRDGHPAFPVMTGVVAASRLEQAVYRGLRIALGEVGPEDFAAPPARGVLSIADRGGPRIQIGE